MTDQVANQDIATSANVAKLDYAGRRQRDGRTAQPVAPRREPRPPRSRLDSFTGTSGDPAHQPHRRARRDLGQPGRWRRPRIREADRRGPRATGTGTGYSIDYTTATPASADYSVGADLYYKGILAGDSAGCHRALNTANSAFYMARWDDRQHLEDREVVERMPPAWLDHRGPARRSTVGRTYRLRLDISGSATRHAQALRQRGAHGSPRRTATSPITAAGKAGIMDGRAGTGPPARPTRSEPPRQLPGDAFDVPTGGGQQGQQHRRLRERPDPGRRGRDSPVTRTRQRRSTALNDYVQVAGHDGHPGRRSVALGGDVVQDHEHGAAGALRLRLPGRTPRSSACGSTPAAATMTAWGFGNGNDKVFTMPYAVNDGAWHQVVETYNGDRDHAVHRRRRARRRRRPP